MYFDIYKLFFKKFIDKDTFFWIANCIARYIFLAKENYWKGGSNAGFDTA